MTLNWAVVGTGTISRWMIEDLLKCEGTNVSVVHSRDEENAARFAEEFGVKSWSDDFDGVCDDPAIDVVYLATPFALHYEMCLRALRGGKHVLVEKPLAMNRQQVEHLFTAAAEADRFLMEAMWMKFNPAFQRMHSEIRDGRIGQVTSVRAAFGVPVTPDGGSRWDMKRSGGALLDQGIYPVTLAHTLLGTPLDLAVTGMWLPDGLDIEAHFSLEFENGAYAQCAQSMTAYTDLAAAISGTAGWITLPAPFWATTALEVHADDPLTIFRMPQSISYEQEGNGYLPMLREVTRSIEAGERQHPLHTAKDTIDVFQTLDRIRTALKAGPSQVPGSTALSKRS